MTAKMLFLSVSNLRMRMAGWGFLRFVLVDKWSPTAFKVRATSQIMQKKKINYAFVFLIEDSHLRVFAELLPQADEISHVQILASQLGSH